tara:strand:- start:2970 stop:3197 length:228 start_codon:yes stop_codon:yes gene_type:complete
MSQAELDEHRAKKERYAKQLKKDRHSAGMREATRKHLYINPYKTVPDARARIAQAIAADERTRRNIEALTEGEKK